MANDAQNQTGVKDVNYDLISVIYHTTKATLLYDQFIQDAEKTGDQELLGFLRDTQSAAKTTADKAQALLAKRLAK